MTLTHRLIDAAAGARDNPRACRRRVNLGWALRRQCRPAPHGLPAPLVVSLTSYPPRFPTLAATLRSLLLQTVAAEAVVLWVAHADAAALPDEVRALQAHGLTIATCDDLRSYKKIIPALHTWPERFIVTADDDVYYWPGWLEALTRGWQPGRREVVSHRVHRITLDEAGQPLPYARWAFEQPAGQPASPLNFSTGIGGVLYPPGSLHADVLRADRFMQWAPRADDVWLHWMLRLNGWSARKVGSARPFVAWDGSQEAALYHGNLSRGENDLSIRALVEAYGFPGA